MSDWFGGGYEYGADFGNTARRHPPTYANWPIRGTDPDTGCEDKWCRYCKKWRDRHRHDGPATRIIIKRCSTCRELFTQKAVGTEGSVCHDCAYDYPYREVAT